MKECVLTRRRVGVVTAAVGATVVGAAFVLAACGVVGTSSAQLDAQFVAAVRADGHDVPQAAEQEATLVTAARKICARRQLLASPVERHRAALTLREIDAVSTTFAGDARRFAALALDTYCPS
ncbi:MAG: hypothetical protein QOK35_1386 [Pseudonocardiales bacterium]|jgi:hypothetical protein|nr:hypothetical protein [Pseudonocardiales bacterium]